MEQYTDITNKKSNNPHAVPLDELAQLCATVGTCLSPRGLEQLAVYLELLMQWNKVMNLVGTHTWQSALLRLVADSFFLAKFLDNLPLQAASDASPAACTDALTTALPDAVPNALPDTSLQIWDLGAGAGLPGIPLRLLWDKGEYSMVEVREKRAVFLSTVLARTALPRTTVFRGRAEDFFARQSRPADMIVSRAFMPWEQLLAFVQPVLAPQAMVVFLASDPAPQQMPSGFRLQAQQSYVIAARKQWFWAISPE